MSSERLQEGRIRLDRQARHFEDDLELPHKTRSLDHGLPHAPATSHGTYLGGLNEDLEDLEFYQLGGYHPIHLGDELGPPGRYRVIHKLGHGGFGTVWLCRDSQASRYVAVKVMTADLSSDLILDLSLLELDQAIPGADYIALPLDRFSLTGPDPGLGISNRRYLSHRLRRILPHLGPSNQSRNSRKLPTPGGLLTR